MNCVGCGIEISEMPHTICAKCSSWFCSTCTDRNLENCPKCGYTGKP